MRYITDDNYIHCELICVSGHGVVYCIVLPLCTAIIVHCWCNDLTVAMCSLWLYDFLVCGSDVVVSVVAVVPP